MQCLVLAGSALGSLPLFGSPTPATSQPLTPVAAEYQLETSPVEPVELTETLTSAKTGQAKAKQNTAPQHWRLWRSPDRVVREYPASQTSEVWQRDGKTVMHTRFYHAQRRGVEFQQADLDMINALPAWTQLESVVSPTLLASLSATTSGTRDNHTWQRYQGVVDGVTWDITVLTDIMLPASVERRDAGHREHLQLLNVWPLGSEPWQPTATDGYDVLDFADLGDHERDPFVVALQQHLDLGHAHDHAH